MLCDSMSPGYMLLDLALPVLCYAWSGLCQCIHPNRISFPDRGDVHRHRLSTRELR